MFKMLISQIKSRLALSNLIGLIGEKDKPKTGFDKLKKEPVAFFCAEYGIDDRLPIYAGGLGILAGDFLLEAESENMPLIGVGIFYHQGFSTYPKSINAKENIDPRNAGFSLVQVNGETLFISVPVGESVVYAQV